MLHFTYKILKYDKMCIIQVLFVAHIHHMVHPPRHLLMKLLH